MSMPRAPFLAFKNRDVLETGNDASYPFDGHIEVTPNDFPIRDVGPVGEGKHGVQGLELDQAPDSRASPAGRTLTIRY